MGNTMGIWKAGFKAEDQVCVSGFMTCTMVETMPGNKKTQQNTFHPCNMGLSFVITNV